EKLIESIQEPINFVREIFERQSLKDEPFETFNAASDDEIERFWKAIHLIDDTVTRDDSTMEHIKQK
ncbi:10827_t:CDS:1, partial [Gigaspora margarita]